MPIRRIALFFILCALFQLPCEISRAEKGAIDDGFQAAGKIESKFFTIYVEHGVDLQEVALQISVPPSIKGIIKNPAPFIDSYELPDQLDTLLLAVLEIMDIRLKKFNCTVKICKDGKALAKIGRRLFGQEMRSGGFYVMSFDTLYVDAESVTMHVLGHELSHAVQVHYFVVPPPVKLSEILSGYVEYQLRKYTQTLPE